MSTLHRNTKGEKTYRDYLKERKDTKKKCVFCQFSKNESEVVKEYKFFYVVKNTFPYTLWDSCTVTNHLMVVPKRHIMSIAKFKADEAAEHFKITKLFEKNGYDIYSRGANSDMKSIAHQHTHLILTDGKKISGLFYLEKPHIHKVF